MQPRPNTKRSVNVNLTVEEWRMIQEMRKEEGLRNLSTRYVSKAREWRDSLPECLFTFPSGKRCRRPATRVTFCGAHSNKSERDEASAVKGGIIKPEGTYIWYNPFFKYYWLSSKSGLVEWPEDNK